MAQILRVAFAQALRSIILILLPVSFVTLVAWATAGSSSGNTADPLRAGLWFFLIAHQVPLQLSLSDATSSGVLTYLPVGALLIPFFAIRSGFSRMSATLGVPNSRQRRIYVATFALIYALLGYLLSLPALGGTVRVAPYIGIPILFLVAGATSFIASGLLPRHEIQFPWQRGLRVAWLITTLLIGVSALLVAASLIWHFSLVVDLTEVVAPGVFGGVTLLLVQILYLPNIAIAALSYLSGAGISIGGDSLVSPYIHRIDEIPAIPLLGALPVTTAPYLGCAALVIALFGVLIIRYSDKHYNDRIEAQRFLLSTLGFVALLNFLLARAAGGQLMSENLPNVGPIFWAAPLLIALQIAIGALALRYFPVLWRRIRSARVPT